MKVFLVIYTGIICEFANYLYAKGTSLDWVANTKNKRFQNQVSHSLDSDLFSCQLYQRKRGCDSTFEQLSPMKEVRSKQAFLYVFICLIVIGEFADQTPVEELVDLGLPFSFACPAHGQRYGASYSWEGQNMIQFSRNQRRGIIPSSGKLLIAFVTQEDIDQIATLGGIRCTVSAANTFYSSGVLTLKKRMPRRYFFS